MLQKKFKKTGWKASARFAPTVLQIDRGTLTELPKTCTKTAILNATVKINWAHLSGVSISKNTSQN